MKNLIKNSMLGLMVVAVAGTQVQAAPVAVMFKAHAANFVKFAKANPVKTGLVGAVLGALALDGGQYGFNAVRNNRKAKALPAAVTKETYDKAVLDRDAVQKELQDASAPVAAAQQEKARLEALKVQTAKGKQNDDVTLKCLADLEAEIKAEADALVALNAKVTEVTAKLAPLVDAVKAFDAQKTAAAEVQKAQANNGMYVVRAPQVLWAKFKKADVTTPTTFVVANNIK